MLEIYNESLRDLLVDNAGSSTNRLDILNTQSSGLNVRNITKVRSLARAFGRAGGRGRCRGPALHPSNLAKLTGCHWWVQALLQGSTCDLTSVWLLVPIWWWCCCRLT